MHQEQSPKRQQKIIAESLSGFKQRFAELLDMEKPAYWAEQAGVSKSLITNRWRGGSYPRADNIIKMLVLSGFSANWLLLGQGRKFLADTRSEQDIARSETERRSIQEDIFKLEEKYDAALEEIQALKRRLAVKQQTDWLAGVLHMAADPSADGARLFQKSLLPVLNLIQSFMFIAFKLLEASLESDDGGRRLVAAVEWIKRNFEKNNYALLSMLSDLDTLLDNETFAALFSASAGDHDSHSDDNRS